MKKIATLFTVLLFVLNLGNANGQSTNASAKEVKKAVCVMNPTQGNHVTGTVTFTQEANGVRVVADIQGLTKGKHGIHIHEFGDCSAPDATSAGGHFNPESHQHGAPMDMNRHAGDMGNIEADESGKAHLDYVDKTMKMEGKNSIVGKSMIIHANEDDMKTQPTGNAGGRVACGVIEAS